MKALIYDWSEESSYLTRIDIIDSFRDLGIEFDTFVFDFQEKGIDELLFCFKQMDISEYAFCFSVNYFPEISEACMRYNLKYISWGYDCPFNVKNIEDTLGNSCNYVFCFDRNQAVGYVKKGFDTVYHLPLGIRVSRYKQYKPLKTQLESFRGDISFVGSLYEGQFPAIREICDDFHKGYLDAIVNAQLQLYGAYILNDVISENFVEEMNQHFSKLQQDTSFCLSKEQLVHLIDQEVSRQERILLLSLLSKRFDTHLYTYHNYKLLKEVHCHGPVDYLREMPYVFAASKINLNISVKGIQTGIPQRAFDIMASGGFLLSNYQQELVEYFPPEEIAVYESMEDAVEKCRFYLKNDDIREKMAISARERVFTEHDMVGKIAAMITTAKI